ncbi:MAG: ATP-binding cassette domain-containing protein, partial [Actinomycetes bacterium]
DRADADAALAAVGAAEYADRRLSQLSGGQQQRVAIAQALVGRPDLLLLDEPLANLDLRNQREVVDLLGQLTSHGVTVVVVVHDLNPLLPHLDGAVYLLDGHAHYGPVAEVVDAELLTHLYGTQVKVVRTAQGDLFTRGA